MRRKKIHLIFTISSKFKNIFTNGDYTDVEVVISNSEAIGANKVAEIKNIARLSKSVVKFDVYEVDASYEVLDFLRSQVGEKWTDVELVTEAFRQAGFPLIDGEPTMEKLTQSPLLVKQETH